jgi:phosphoglycolate phosphatase-like HAD superfamily hydrolase
VGDSVTDIEAGRAAGVATVGYANKPGKDVDLAGADAVVTAMAELALAVRRVRWR